MLPEGEENLLVDETETEEALITSRTYRLNEDSLTVAGEIDDLDAIKQSLSLILQTERGAYEIYSEDYGTELTALIGQPAPLVYVNLEEAIKDALLQDDRVESVDQFEFEQVARDSVAVRFIVTTIQGEIDIETEVNING